VPVVGPGSQQRDRRDHGHPSSGLPHHCRLPRDKVQNEFKPRDRQHDDAEILDLESEQLLGGIVGCELPGVRGARQGDGQQQRAVPGCAADTSMPKGIPGQWKQDRWSDNERQQAQFHGWSRA
jgi:hypothetical protein